MELLSSPSSLEPHRGFRASQWAKNLSRSFEIHPKPSSIQPSLQSHPLQSIERPRIPSIKLPKAPRKSSSMKYRGEIEISPNHPPHQGIQMKTIASAIPALCAPISVLQRKSSSPNPLSELSVFLSSSAQNSPISTRKRKNYRKTASSSFEKCYNSGWESPEFQRLPPDFRNSLNYGDYSQIPAIYEPFTGDSADRRKNFALTRDSNNRYQSMDADDPRYLGKENLVLVEFLEKEGEEALTEQIPFRPGQSLDEALESRLRERGISVEGVAFFVEGSTTPLPEGADARNLQGYKIIVRSRSTMRVSRNARSALSMDETSERASRKVSVDAVSRKTSFVNAKMLAKSRQASECSRSNGSEEVLDSTRSRDSSHRDLTHLDEPSCSENLQIEDGSSTRRNRSVTSSRISLFFGKDKTEMLNRLTTFRDLRQKQSPKLEIEDSWRSIVDTNTMHTLSRKAADQQEAIWEIVSTEYNYISLLRTMDELACCLADLHRHNLLKDIDLSRVFINYSELFHANVNFWNRAIHPMLSEARKKRSPLDPAYLFTGFEDIHEWSRCYIQFHLHHDEAHAYVGKKAKEHELFREFLTWAESQDGMRRQKLLDMLKCPMQRITRYSLLLKAVLRTSTHNEEQILLQSMVDRAESATHQLNFEMNNNDLRLQLHEVMKSIEGADYVDGEEFEKAFKNRCVPNLAHPMALRGGPVRFRRVHMRAELKVKEGRQAPKVDMHCIIFTDMLLMCKNPNKRGDKLRIARPPIHISKIYYQPFLDQPCGFYMMVMSDFDVPSALYLMYTTSMDETKRFLEMLGSAREEFYHLQKEDSPLDEFYRGNFESPTHSMNSIIHRKSSSMDSQVVAAAHSYLHHMRNSGKISSTEQLDRGMGLGGGEWTNRNTPTHKLSVASCHAAPISQSKSSVDLHTNGRASSPEHTRHRSRSNSSGPELADGHDRSRTPSPTLDKPLSRASRLDTPRDTPRTSSPQPNSPEERTAGSPALLVTSTEEDDQTPSSSGRRFEKRYHTADGIDVFKPKGGPMPTGILKRFSWNVSTAMGSSRKINSKLQEQHSRRHSQSSTAASSESFGSSTSGISSTGSHLDSVKDEECKSHVSTICIGEDSCDTLNGSLDSPLQSLPEYPNDTMNGGSSSTINGSSFSHPPRGTPPIVCTPPITDDTPPILQAPPIVHQPLMINSKTPPPPQSQPPSTCASLNQKMIIGAEHQLLKFIMDNKLETSDV